MTPRVHRPLGAVVLLASGAGAAAIGAKFTGLAGGAGGCGPALERRVVEERTVNTWTASAQSEPALAADASGRMLVVWASRRQEDGAFGVFAQALDPLGRPIGTEAHVNVRVEGEQARPAVAFDPAGGRAVVVWESTHQDGSGAGIVGRWFEVTESGVAGATGEFAVNAVRAGEQTSPSVAVDARGRALVGWTSEEDGVRVARVRGFDVAGLPLTEELAVGGARAHGPIVAAGAEGFVVVGSARDGAGRPAALWMQRIDGDWRAGEAVAVAERADLQDVEPSVAVDGAGRVVVAWMRRGERGYSVVRRAFDAAGVAAGPELVVAESGERRLSGVSVCAAPDGRSVVSWNEEERAVRGSAGGARRGGSEVDVVAARFDARGVMLGAPERVHVIEGGRQALPIGSVAARAVWTGRDQIAHVWHGRTGEDAGGVGFTLSRPATLTAPRPVVFAARPAVTPREFGSAGVGAAPDAPPVFDPNFVPEPPDVTARGVGVDFGFLGTQNTGWRPPDPEVAVGPSHVVVVVNGQIAFRRKSDGVQTFSATLTGAGGFWGAQGAGGFVFDPIAQFDPYTGRFVVAASERNGAQQVLAIAVSDDGDPNGAWNKFRVDVSGFGADIDYPIMGIDEHAVYLTADFFAPPTGNWIFIFDKADLLAGVVTMQGVQSEFGPNPLGAVMNYDAGSPAQYFVTSYSGSGTQLLLKAVTDPLGTPVLHEFALGVPFFEQPPQADQLGSSNLVSTVDLRIKHGVVRNGSMWVAHNTNVPDGMGPFSQDPIARVRWHEIELNGWPTSGMNPSVRQTGTIHEGVGVHTWFPDIGVDAAGNAGIVFSRSSANEFVSVARAVRRATDPLGTFRQAVTQQVSTTPEPEDRWGDYAGIQEDPSAPGVFWGHSEYRTSSWRTWVGRFSPLTPNPLDFALVSPANGAAEVSVTATLDWQDAQDASSYDVTVATDAAMTNVVATATVGGSSWAIPPGTLACGVQHWWGVVATSAGGDTDSTPGAFTFTTGLAADFNGDDIVDTADLGLLIGAFGTSGPTGDLNGDNVVDTADLGLLIAGFGMTCGP